MSLAARKDTGATITPAVHLEFIQNQAGLPEGVGLEEIEEATAYFQFAVDGCPD